MARKKKLVEIKLVIPDASPILTLARLDRLDLLQLFAVPIHIVDQVHYEVTKPENDPQGRVAAMFRTLHNQLVIVETNVGVGFQTRRARDPSTPSRNLGEIAVDARTSPGQRVRPSSRWCCSRTRTCWSCASPS